MKHLLTGLAFLCIWGCVSIPTQAPDGCEEAMVWQTGFMPQGRELVELGFAALLTAQPQLKPRVKAGALKAWRLVKGGTLKGAVAELLVLLDKYPQYAPLALYALQRLDLERTLSSCDQEVLLAMCHNIALYAGAGEQDFSDSLAEMGSLPATRDH